MNPEPKQRNIRPRAIQYNPLDWSNYRQRVQEFCDRLNSVSDCEQLLLLSEDFIRNESKYYALISEKQFKNFQLSLADLSSLFPKNHTDPNRLKILMKILLEQQLETCWYDEFPRYVNAEDIKIDVKVRRESLEVDLNPFCLSNQVFFYCAARKRNSPDY